jgi:hypothetical protein
MVPKKVGGCAGLNNACGAQAADDSSIAMQATDVTLFGAPLLSILSC